MCHLDICHTATCARCFELTSIVVFHCFIEFSSDYGYPVNSVNSQSFTDPIINPMVCRNFEPSATVLSVSSWCLEPLVFSLFIHMLAYMVIKLLIMTSDRIFHIVKIIGR